MEKDDEVVGNGNEYDYGMRIYNPRLGRFLSIDPSTKEYPMLTPYQFASNSPIAGIDLDGLEFYYTADGTLIGKIGDNTSVRVVDQKDIKAVSGYITWANYSDKPKHQEHATNQANKFSKDVGMSNDELNTRAFMSTIKQTEVGGNTPLNYNSKHGFEAGEVKTFTEKTYEEAPEDYKEHPYKGESGGTAAGAYQILYPTYKLYKKAFPEITDFSPINQDKTTLAIFTETKAIGDIQSGNLDAAVKKLTAKPVQFASLPGGGQEHGMVMKQVRELFKKNVSNELNNKSNIAIPKGKIAESTLSR